MCKSLHACTCTCMYALCVQYLITGFHWFLCSKEMVRVHATVTEHGKSAKVIVFKKKRRKNYKRKRGTHMHTYCMFMHGCIQNIPVYDLASVHCTSVKIIKNEIRCRDDTVPKTVGTRSHCKVWLRACNNLPQPQKTKM